MASTASSLLRLELQAAGENNQSWGGKANNDFELIEKAIAGAVSIPILDANLTLTANNWADDQARYAILKFTGVLTANRTVTIPAVSKIYIVTNATTGGSGYSVILSNGSNTVTIGTGLTRLVATDGSAIAGSSLVDGTIWTSLNDGSIFPGAISGLTLSNSVSDAINDIDIAAGSAASTTTVARMTLASAITKRLDAVWAVGTNQGGRDTATAIANQTYHVFLIKRVDTGVVDALFSSSATSPTMPTNYTLKRRIGSIIRSSGIIANFHQTGDHFLRDVIVNDSFATTNTSGLIALDVPSGIQVRPLMQVGATLSVVNADFSLYFSGGYLSSANFQVLHISTGPSDSYATAEYLVPPYFLTNTSRQIYYSRNWSGAVTAADISTLGWIDERDK